MSATHDGEGALLAGIMRELAPRASGMEPHLAAAIDRTVDSPGGLLRARLVLAAARGHGLPGGMADQLAAAVEFFHAASLLFDDLPCMDDATTRRGRPCAHRVHGDATAILAALALINRAHALIGVVYAAYPAAIRLQASLLLDETLGAGGVIGGQARDLRYGEGPTGRREAGRIAAAKTGALFRLALVLPVLAAGPTPEEFRLLKALAVYWGQWFQARDDLKDVLATPAEAGKDTRRDRALARPNLALALGLAGTRRRIARLEAQLARVRRQLCGHGPRWRYLDIFHETLSARARAA